MTDSKFCIIVDFNLLYSKLVSYVGDPRLVFYFEGSSDFPTTNIFIQSINKTCIRLKAL